MRFVAVYRPADPTRVGKGRREFLYPAAVTEDHANAHAAENVPPGWKLDHVRPAEPGVDFVYLEVPHV